MMNDNRTLFVVLIGFFCMFSIVMVIKTIRNYYIFKASFYTEIYSGLFEYITRKKSLKRMSQSYWLERELGSHRIMYQITKTKYENIVQPYILILLTTGLYVIQIHNESAHYICHQGTLKKITENKNKEKIVQNLPFPISEFKNFQYHFELLLDNTVIPMRYILAFTDHSQLDIYLKDISVIQKKQLIQTIKEYHLQSKDVYSKEDIERIYYHFTKKIS